jgi:patatin-like phospholipase/acyl hydrolase
MIAAQGELPMGAANIAKINPYRILSVDGGGLRGIIPLVLLERLDVAAPGWRKNINMFAGTSTGGLIALCLAKGMSPSELLNVYMTRGAFIFESNLWHKIKDLGEITGPKYDSANREQVCKDVLGTLRLKDLRSKDGNSGHVVITSFDLDDQSAQDPSTRRWKAKIFHNVPTADDSGDDNEYAYRVAMRTSAAPTYFASYDGFVDGGVFANNPSMCGLAQTQDPRLSISIPYAGVKMISLGTGFFPYHLDGDENWGLAQWAPHFVNLLMDGVNEVCDFQANQLMTRGNYCRAAPKMQTDIAMDDPSQAGMLQRIGNNFDISAAAKFVGSW